MLETQETFSVNAPRSAVWAYASDMRNWANKMPGFQSFEVLNDTDSRWTLRIAVGPFKRTVILRVHITDWAEPERIGFWMKSENDPVQGAGAFLAQEVGDRQTRVAMRLTLDSSGPMAGMMETMIRPVLPRMAKSFAEEMTREIETRAQQP
jgi:carbon monoxide dehydrogenase subunit G